MHESGEVRLTAGVPGKSALNQQVRIVDPEGMRSILRLVLDQFESHQEAADALGIHQTTFTRLLNGTTERRMRFNTFAAIRDALGCAPLFEMLGAFQDEMFEGTVLRGDGWQIYRDYHNWLDDEIARLEPRVASVWMELWGLPEYQELFRKFFKAITRKPNPPKTGDRRYWLAVYRALEPLGAAEATHGIELSWQELHVNGKLTQFLRAALRRERLMLERGADLERANRRQLPEDYYE